MINLSRHTRMLLSPSLRQPRITALAQTLISPLSETADRFESAAAKAEYRVYADGSIISLTHHIKRELGVDVFIQNTPDAAADFRVMINTPGADPEQVRDFVNRYKVAGRRFVLYASPLTATFVEHACESINYSAKFVEHACETVNYSAKFVGHACESLKNVYVTADAENGHEVTTVTVKTGGALVQKGWLRVDGEVYMEDTQAYGLWKALPFTANIMAGYSEGFVNIPNDMTWYWAPCGTGIFATRIDLGSGVYAGHDDLYTYYPDASESPLPTPEPK